jgi:hypothetical protein
MTRNKKLAFTEEEFKDLFQEPDLNYIEKCNTLSSDGKNLLVRIPKEFVTYFDMKKGDKLRFYAVIDNKEKPTKIEVSLEK